MVPAWAPLLDVEAGEVVEDEALWLPPLPIGGNTIRIPDPEFPPPPGDECLGCKPTAFATALMIAAFVKLFPEDADV